MVRRKLLFKVKCNYLNQWYMLNCHENAIEAYTVLYSQHINSIWAKEEHPIPTIDSLKNSMLYFPHSLLELQVLQATSF